MAYMYLGAEHKIIVFNYCVEVIWTTGTKEFMHFHIPSQPSKSDFVHEY